MRVQLVPLEAGTEPIEIIKDLILIGRKEDCDIQLDHKSVSKIHCIIVKTDNLLLLRDLGSTNGTRVNGQRVRRAALVADDQLNIASLRYRVEFKADKAPAVRPEDHTQHLDAREVAKLMKPADAALESANDDSAPDVDMPPIQANSLPDIYPDGTERSDR